MLAFSSAVLFLILNLIGLGLGPLFVGALSDYLLPTMGAETLRWALVSTAIVSTIAAFCFYLASRTIEPDLDRVP